MVDDGLTMIDAPEPIKVPPQLTGYQFHEAPAPSEPPVTVKVEEPLEQTVVGAAVAPVGAVEEVFTATAKADNVPGPQPLIPSTVMLPEVAPPLKSTVMAFVFVPEAIVAPAGNTQL